MMASTHAALGIVTYAGITAIVGGSPVPATLGAAAVGAWLPDVDSPQSKAGFCLYPLAAFLERRYGHRTVTHSWVGAAVFALLCLPLLFFPALKVLYWPFLIGYMSHLLGDAATKSGVPLAWPSRAPLGCCGRPAAPAVSARAGSFLAAWRNFGRPSPPRGSPSSARSRDPQAGTPCPPPTHPDFGHCLHATFQKPKGHEITYTGNDSKRDKASTMSESATPQNAKNEADEVQAVRWTKRLVPELTCLCCGYEWLPRNPEHIPKKCPKCLTKLWNVPRSYQLQGKPKPSRKRGAPTVETTHTEKKE